MSPKHPYSDDQAQIRRQFAREIDLIVGQRLKKARQDVGVTQQQLGAFMGLTFQSIQRYEKGVSGISTGRLVQAAQVIGGPISYFFQDVIDLDGNVVPIGEGASRPPLVSHEAMQVARLFDSINSDDERRYLLKFVERVAKVKCENPD